MKTGRKFTGAKYHASRKKRLFEKDSQERIVTLSSETKLKKIRARGGNIKTVVLRTNQVNLAIDGKVKKTEIKNVLETPQNTFLARQNRLVKGAIIETPLGKAKITNRPSQEGQINAVLIK